MLWHEQVQPSSSSCSVLDALASTCCKSPRRHPVIRLARCVLLLVAFHFSIGRAHLALEHGEVYAIIIKLWLCLILWQAPPFLLPVISLTCVL